MIALIGNARGEGNCSGATQGWEGSLRMRLGVIEASQSVAVVDADDAEMELVFFGLSCGAGVGWLMARLLLFCNFLGGLMSRRFEACRTSWNIASEHDEVGHAQGEQNDWQPLAS